MEYGISPHGNFVHAEENHPFEYQPLCPLHVLLPRLLITSIFADRLSPFGDCLCSCPGYVTHCCPHQPTSATLAAVFSAAYLGACQRRFWLFLQHGGCSALCVAHRCRILSRGARYVDAIYGVRGVALCMIATPIPVGWCIAHSWILILVYKVQGSS